MGWEKEQRKSKDDSWLNWVTTSLLKKNSEFNKDFYHYKLELPELD